jgi:hypothetical protein
MTVLKNWGFNIRLTGALKFNRLNYALIAKAIVIYYNGAMPTGVNKERTRKTSAREL